MRRVSKLNKDYMYFYTKVSSANVTPAGRMVYRALLRYANRKTWSCFPSVKTIVRRKHCWRRCGRNHRSRRASCSPWQRPSQPHR